MRSERKMLPIGVENFEKLRRNNMYYVDKTEIIADLLRNHGDANLFTRPRRFGKTLTMDTLKTFFEIGQDASLFEGLPSADIPTSAKSTRTNTPLYLSA